MIRNAARLALVFALALAVFLLVSGSIGCSAFQTPPGQTQPPIVGALNGVAQAANTAAPASGPAAPILYGVAALAIAAASVIGALKGGNPGDVSHTVTVNHQAGDSSTPDGSSGNTGAAVASPPAAAAAPAK